MDAELAIEYMQIDELIPYVNNAKKHPEKQVREIANSIDRFGNCDPIAVWHNAGGGVEIVEGHGRALALEMLGIKEAPVIFLDHLTDEERRAYTHIHNQTTMSSGFDMEILTSDFNELDFDWTDFGFDYKDLFGFGDSRFKGNLGKRFSAPPFSILDAKKAEWAKRKHAWNNMISDNAERGDSELFSSFLDGFGNKNSMLDPALVETLLLWFAPYDGASVFDCFAGDPQGSFVSAYNGYNYTGIELRQEQVDFNVSVLEGNGLTANYICDDGRNVGRHLKKESQDLLISCPPYFDLEVYSDMSEDASNQKDFDSFYKILDEAYSAAIPCLKDDRFACIICTDLRGKDGIYYDFVERIRRTFERNGMGLYNHLILATPFGSAAMRANGSMASRKAVRVHQDVLVFYKGDTGNIKDVFRDLSYDGDGRAVS